MKCDATEEVEDDEFVEKNEFRNSIFYIGNATR